MKAVAFFNNKGGVGKTSLAYHLAWMFGELGYRVLAVDLDPQANLSGMFLDENRLGKLWEGRDGRHTIDRDIAPLFDGVGDIATEPNIEEMSEKIGLLTGDLRLSKREDELSTQWPKCLGGDARAFRVTTAFSRLIHNAGSFEPDIVLIDVGPNFGAINRAALIASDYVVIPLAPDLFSLQGIRNVGPTLKEWRRGWRKRIEERPDSLDIPLPSGKMKPAGYVIMRHSVRLYRPVQAYSRWIEKIPSTYRQSVLDEKTASAKQDAENDPHCLAHLKDYRPLMPMAQEARKPMFKLKPADGAIGAHLSAAGDCYADFKELAKNIITACDIPAPGDFE